MRTILYLLIVTLWSCAGPSGTAPKKKAEKKAPELVGAQSAFYKMFGMARNWSQDTQALRCDPLRMQAMADKDGKFPAWRCVFVSQTRRLARSFTYSVIEAEGIHEGVFAEPESSWAGPSGQNQPFIIQAFKIDAGAAVLTALEKGKEYSRKHPGLPITPQLEKVKQFPNPVWRVLWGTSVNASNFSVYVDATTGEYLQTMH